MARRSADVTIIGGGIAGASIAYHLTSAGCRDVLVLERETHLGRGSTGKSMGGVRAQFSTAVNIRMSLYSIPMFRDFEQITGHPSGYRSQGYLFVATRESHLRHLAANYEQQIAAGLTNVARLDPDGVTRLCPQLRADDILGGSFCPTDGFVDPYSVMNGFMACARRNGAELTRGVEVTAIRRDAAGVAEVETRDEVIATRTVVIAAGAWSAAIGALVGIELPVTPLRRMLVPTEPFDGVSHLSPMVVDMGTGFHFRPEGLGLLLAWNDPDETPGFKANFDPAFVEKILTRGVDRVPCLEHAAVNPRRAWAGLYEMTPDHHPVLGPIADVPGLWCAAGFSGHGVMHSPATGRVIADLILTGASDLAPAGELGFERFAAGRLLHESAVL